MRWARLALLATLAALATSRLTLAVHELVGHGGPVVLAGGTVDEVRLYLFAGGAIRYTLPDAGDLWSTVTALGGLALEVVMASLALLVLRRLPPGHRARFLCAAFATILFVHAAYYLAVGVHHGYGDGWWIARRLGAARAWVAWPAAALALACAGPLAALLAREAAAWVPGASVRVRVAALAGAALVAGGAHLGLALGELALTETTTYRETMKPQVERDVDAAVRAMLEDAARRGALRPAPAQVDAERARVRDAERVFPLDLVLGAAIGVAALLGFARGLRKPVAPLDARHTLWVAASLAFMTLLLIGVLQFVF